MDCGCRWWGAKKYPTGKAYLRRKLVLIDWAKKLLKPPNMAF